MTLDPRVGMWLSFLAAALTAVAAFSGELTSLFGQAMTVKILAVDAILLGLVNAVLHMIPSKSTPAALEKFPLGSGKPEA